MHTFRAVSSAMSSTQITNTWLVPSNSGSAPCDYFIGMFNDFGVQTAGSQFDNQMYGYNSNNQMLTNSIGATVDATEGLLFSSGDTQIIQGVSITNQRAIGVQFWFKGSFTNNQVIAAIAKSGAVKSVYMERLGANFVLKTTHSATSVTFAGANSSLNSNAWTFIGFSLGWMARGNNFMM